MKKTAPQEVAQALLRIQDNHKELRFLLAGSTNKFDRIAQLSTEIRDNANIIRQWVYAHDSHNS